MTWSALEVVGEYTFMLTATRASKFFKSEQVQVHHRRSQDFWLGGGAQTLKNSAVFTEILGQNRTFERFFPEIRWSPKKKRSSPKLRVVFRPKPLALLLLYCLITVMCAITEKKLQLNIVRLCCHNFLSLVEFWLGGGGPGPLGPPWLRLWSTLFFFRTSKFRVETGCFCCRFSASFVFELFLNFWASMSIVATVFATVFNF